MGSISREPSPSTEATPLLRIAASAPQSRSLLDRIRGIPLYARVASCMFLYTLSSQLPALSALDVANRLICTLWYLKYDPDRLPPDREVSKDMCKEPGPTRTLSIFFSVQALLTALFAFILCSVIAQYSARTGRKPLLLILLFGSFSGISCFLTAIIVNEGFAAFGLLLAYQFCDLLFSGFGIMLLGNIMVTDITTPEERTAALSVIGGAYAAGSSISFITGGTITAKTGNPLVTCLLAIGCGILSILNGIFLPETFGREKIEAAKVERIERARRARAYSLERWLAEEGDRSRGPRRVARKTAQGILSVFEPLTRLKPTRNPRTGWLNVRLLNIATCSFMTSISSNYLTPALLTYMLGVLQFGPQEGGEILSTLTAAQTFSYFVLIPAVTKWGRPLYTKSRKSRSQFSFPEDPHNSDDKSLHFDVWLLAGSLFIDAMFMSGFGLVRTKWHMIAVALFLGFGAGHRPALQSVATASVEPVVSGEVLSAITMIQQVAGFAAPVLLGYFASRTVTTRPSAIFLLMGAIIFASGSLALLIRDEDRYFPPATETNGEATHEEPEGHRLT